MGVIRGGLVFILGIILLISLIAGSVFLTLSLSANPENLKEKIISESSKLIESKGTELVGGNVEEKIDEILPVMESYCENNTNYIFSQEGYTIDIPCEKVKGGKEAIIEEGISDIVDEVYSEEYSCNSVSKCVFNGENPFYLLSEEAKREWKGYFYMTLIVSILIILLIFFILSNKIDIFLVSGFLIILSSLPILGINKITALLVDSSLLQVIPLLFSKAGFVFSVMFIIGIALLIIGILSKFFNVGHSLLEKMNSLKSNKGTKKEKA
tara:strand:- start:444 stop:1247 length:804 start_codon:yes stop_codon:yes gene_type:complete